MKPKRRQIAERRAEPGVTEQTLASLVSSPSARTILQLEANTPGINGMYIPSEDRIVLFRCRGDVPAVGVALEEAGHSLERREYLRLSERMEEVGQKLSAWHPEAKYLIDWLEDGRIFGLLKAEYPGVDGELDTIFDVRRATLEQTSWKVGTHLGAWRAADFARVQAVAQEFLKIVELYEQGRVPTTLDGVLDYCEKLVENKPQDYPSPGEGAEITVCGNANKKHQRTTPDIGEIAHTVTITDAREGASHTNRRSCYGWPVIDERTIA